MNRYLLCLIAILCTIQIIAQTKSELEKRKQQLTKDIEFTSKVLKETQKNKEATLNQLVTLNKQINIRESLINTISSEVRIIEKQIGDINNVINTLQAELAQLKKEYAAMVVFAYRNQSSYNKLMFIFAAENFNQAYKRLKYLQQFGSYRQKQAEYILETQRDLNYRIVELENKKRQKNGLLLDEQKEKVTLSKEKDNQTKIVRTLQDKEKQLKKELQEKQKAAQKLNKAIEDIIRKEIEAARKKAEAEAKARGEKPPAKSDALALTPEAQKLSADFTSNKGSLPWPVEKGIITERFGEHPHPVLKGVMVRNNGVDIKTNPGSSARAIFSGEVTGVIAIPGGQSAVLVRHGEYVTVYSNLRSVSVKRGDKISTKQLIGTVFTDEKNSETEIHFEIWKGMDKLDPSAWLAN